MSPSGYIGCQNGIVGAKCACSTTSRLTGLFATNDSCRFGSSLGRMPANRAGLRSCLQTTPDALAAAPPTLPTAQRRRGLHTSEVAV
jgi:hypothetical protein